MPQNFVALQQQFIQRFEIKNVESLQLICKFKEDNKMSEIAICNDRDFEQLKQRHLKQSKKRNKNTGQNVLKIKTSVITKEEQFDENMSQETILKILSENIDIARKIKYDSDIQKKLNENLMPCRSCILQNDIERQIQQKSSNSLQKELDSNIFPTPSKCKVCSDKKFIKFSNTLRMVQHLTQEQLIFHFRNFYKCYSDYCKQVQKDKDRQKEECYAEEEDIWESEDGSSEEEIEKSENESYEEEDMDDEQDNESYEEEDSEDNLSSQDDASFSSITMKRSTKQKTKKLRQNDCRKTMKFYQKEEQYENQLEHIQMEQFNIENQFQQQETQQELIKKKQITTSHSPLFAWIYQNKQSKNAKYNAKDKKSFQFTMEKSRAEIKDNVIELKIVLYNNSEICWPNPIYLQGSEDNLYTNGVFIQLNENISSKKTRIISCKYDTNKLNDKLHQKDNQQVTQSKYSKKQYSQVDQCQEQQIDEDTKKLISFRFVNQQENFSTDYFTLQLKEKKKFNFFAICDFI